MYSVKEHMNITEEILKAENCFIPSEIEGLSDLLWSMGARCLYPGGEALIRWFNTPVPAFDNHSPISILKNDGEEALFVYMIRLHT